MSFWVTFGVCYAAYLLLVWTGGAVELSELVVGALVALLSARLSHRFFAEGSDMRMASLSRWGTLLRYLFGPFARAMAEANIDVAKRVITGELRPGIVRISPGLRTELGRMLLANSITLTPGTLTVDVDEETGDFFVHWIYVREEDPPVEQVCGHFPEWVRRIAE